MRREGDGKRGGMGREGRGDGKEGGWEGRGMGMEGDGKRGGIGIRNVDGECSNWESNQEKNLWSKDENQQQTQPTSDTRSGN